MSPIEPTAASPYPSFTAAQPVRDAILTVNRQLRLAFGEGDAEAVGRCYTHDAMLMPAHRGPIIGPRAIAGFWGHVMDLGVADMRLETDEVEGQGELAVEVGRYTLYGADGGAVDDGKYVVVWHNDRGQWKLHRDIWTTSRGEQPR